MKKIISSKFFTLTVLCIGVSFISYGLLRGELAVMYEKAVNICLECIGIG